MNDKLRVQVDTASGWKLNYLMSLAVKHQSRTSWSPGEGQKMSFMQWQGYERAWGNPIPDYVSEDFDQKYLIELLDAGYSLQHADMALGYKVWRSVGDTLQVSFGDTPNEAIIKSYVKFKLYYELDVHPEYKDIPLDM